MVDRLERLVNLTATLLDTRRPLTLDELSDRVEPRYPEDKLGRGGGSSSATRRRCASSASRSGSRPPTASASDQAYRIHPDDYYLPELELTEAELAALHVAVTAVRLEGDAGREGLAKLGGLAGEGADSPLAELDVTPGLAVAVRRGEPPRAGHVLLPGRRPPPRPLRRGAALRALVRGRPRPRPRRPAGVPGRPHRRRGPSSAPTGSFTPPAGIDPAEFVRADPMTYGEDQPVDAHVLVDAPRAGWVVDQLGEEAVLERRPDGAVVVTLPVVNRAAFRTWVVDLLDHAEVLVTARAARRHGRRGSTPIAAAAKRVSRPLVGPRLQRVLALVPWILAHPGVTLAELAARFEVAERELERDLELLPMCGLPPYTADRLIDVSVIDGGVEIRLAEYFERPLRLTPAEGLALLAAGRALLAVPGSDADGPAGDRAGQARRRARRAREPRGRRRRERPARAAAGRVRGRRARRDRLLLVRARRDDHAGDRPVAGVPRVRDLVRRRLVPPRRGRAPLPRRPRACGARHGRRTSTPPRGATTSATSSTTRAPTTRG